MTYCKTCLNEAQVVSAVVGGRYHAGICRSCLADISNVRFSSGATGFDRRRTYEDNAQDTVQPFDAGGHPRPEFYRLYPTQAQKIFSPAEIEQVKRQL